MNVKRHITMVLAAAGFGAASLSAVAAFAGNDEIEVTGDAANVSGACPDLQFTLGSQQVTTDARTEFDDGNCTDVRDGTRVHVEGRMGDGGALVASEVELEDDVRVAPQQQQPQQQP